MKLSDLPEFCEIDPFSVSQKTGDFIVTTPIVEAETRYM